jgi:hypothetical protein
VRHGRTAEAKTRTAQGHTAKGAQRIFARQRPLPCAVGKGNARHRPLSCAKCDARQRIGVDGRPQRDGVTHSLPCATQILTAQKKKKKEKKARQAGARLRQATTTPPPAAGPPFPTPATPPPPHAGRTARSAAASPQQLRRELGPPRE